MNIDKVEINHCRQHAANIATAKHFARIRMEDLSPLGMEFAHILALAGYLILNWPNAANGFVAFEHNQKAEIGVAVAEPRLVPDEKMMAEVKASYLAWFKESLPKLETDQLSLIPA